MSAGDAASLRGIAAVAREWTRSQRLCIARRRAMHFAVERRTPGGGRHSPMASRMAAIMMLPDQAAPSI